MSIQRHIFLWLIPYTVSMAATSSTIEGHITDTKSGEPLIGANIMLTETSLGSASDENGAYIIKNIPIGNYTLKAMFIGYETLDKEIRVEGDQAYIIDITLKPSAIELQETKVSAEKRKEKVTGAPASMEIVTSRDIKGKTTTNMGAYLKGLKGIDFTSSGINNYSISVRGFNSSFNTRLLTLSDGRVANIPALRVINYSTIPQSMDDVDKIEVILGPATALYGANAHSGVVNIISKPPSQSEGFSMSLAGSNDERQLRKINGRFAKNLTNTISIKLSGLYLHAYDWPYISEEEYKAHLYPWSGAPFRDKDGKDNNPWSEKDGSLLWQVNNQGDSVRIGDGEPNHEDWDGDGVAGEDWLNGYDDDGDGLVDEDYFTADGKDNGGSIICTADTNEDGCVCCWGDYGVDENIDMSQDIWYDGVDNDNNGVIDDESGSENLEASIAFWGGNIENNILIYNGRKDSLIDDNANPYYLSNRHYNNTHVFGNHRYRENDQRLEFDIFNYDFGLDEKPGDPFIDLQGDEKFQKGEGIEEFFGSSYFLDYGLDGEPNTNDADGTEGDGIWQPGDGWVDKNGNGEIDSHLEDDYLLQSEEDYNDVYPLKNGIWDPTEIIYDCGNDGFCWGDSNGDGLVDDNDNSNDWTIGDPHYVENLIGDSIWVYGPDPGEEDGPAAWDHNENDGIFDIGDGNYGWEAEPFIDENNNGRWDAGELFTDLNGDNRYTHRDIDDNFSFVDDKNGDGLSDYPDFEIDNRKVEFRIDYDPTPDFNLTFQSGYSWTKTQQVTGTGRYLADGFEYTFYQLRGRYKNLFSQLYMNESFSGNTRGYNLGNRIIDKSKNYAYQIQHNFLAPFINTKLVWGMDYFRTEPRTFGTILNDGPNGYDNDGDNLYIRENGIDDDHDGIEDDFICPDGQGPGFRYGQVWACEEGMDEPDEFIDPVSNEYGLYYQSTSELFGSSRYEFITAARLDYHDLLAEGVLFAPKLGFIYKPNEKSSFRFTYGKAHNTPSSITLFTDIFIGTRRVFDIYLRGNHDGTAYCRVGKPCLEKDYPTTIVAPGFYSEDTDTFYNIVSESSYFLGDDNMSPYTERVNGAPYYFKFPDAESNLGGDMTPIDTAYYAIYIPELNGLGVLYSPEETYNIPDVDPIKTEKIQTFEFGYKSFLGNKTHFTLDYYLSYYEDFFSPPTVVTPWVVMREFDNNGNDVTNINDLDISGIMPINALGTNPPYGTAWNGLDDNGNWEEWADEFGWRDDDKNNDCLPGADVYDDCWADPGEWGMVHWNTIEGDTLGYDIYHPYEVLILQEGFPEVWNLDLRGGKYESVGIDEFHESVGLAEYEPLLTGLTDDDGNPIPFLDGDGNPVPYKGKANSPYHVVLSPMNYGEVWMQGCDMGITHFLSDKLIVDGNVSWYGTTDFYNELTKKNDPINAPKWKWNASIKWNSDLGDVIVNFRHVDKFKWSDGIWAGEIGPYNIFDLFYTYHITDHLDFNLSALNLNNDQHKELIGGAVMGRQIVMRFTSTF